jgi:hypothetical protein
LVLGKLLLFIFEDFGAIVDVNCSSVCLLVVFIIISFSLISSSSISTSLSKSSLSSLSILISFKFLDLFLFLPILFFYVDNFLFSFCEP